MKPEVKDHTIILSDDSSLPSLNLLVPRPAIECWILDFMAPATVVPRNQTCTLLMPMFSNLVGHTLEGIV